jgi:hypothetical protein
MPRCAPRNLFSCNRYSRFGAPPNQVNVSTAGLTPHPQIGHVSYFTLTARNIPLCSLQDAFVLEIIEYSLSVIALFCMGVKLDFSQ